MREHGPSDESLGYCRTTLRVEMPTPLNETQHNDTLWKGRGTLRARKEPAMLKRTSFLLTMALFGSLGLAIASLADEPKTGETRDTLLYVRTVPPGAKVLLDGKELGKSDDIF